MAITWNNAADGSGTDPGSFPFHMSASLYSQLRTYVNNRYQHIHGSGSPVSALAADATKKEIAVFLKACHSTLDGLVGPYDPDLDTGGFYSSTWGDYDGVGSAGNPFSFSAADLDNTNWWRPAIDEMRQAIEDMLYVKAQWLNSVGGFNETERTHTVVRDFAEQTIASGGTWDESGWSPQYIPAYPNSNASDPSTTQLSYVQRELQEGSSGVPTNAIRDLVKRSAAIWKWAFASVRDGHELVELSMTGMTNAFGWASPQGSDGLYGIGVPATLVGTVQVRGWVDSDSIFSSPDVNRADGTLIEEHQNAPWPEPDESTFYTAQENLTAVDFMTDLSLVETPSDVYLKIYGSLDEDPQANLAGWGLNAVQSGSNYFIEMSGYWAFGDTLGQNVAISGPHDASSLTTDLVMRYIIVD